MPKTGTSPFFMPEIGQVERGQDISKLTSAWYVFAACVDCGAGRWVQYHDDRHQNQRCRKCAGIRRGQSYRESHLADACSRGR